MESRVFELEFSFSQGDVIAFANVTGDNNPIHLDDDFAGRSVFKRKIIHGYLGASVFSKILGTSFPGKGTIYLKQDLKFLAPMFTDQMYMARVEIVEVIKERKRARLSTQVLDKSGSKIIDGEALIQNNIYGSEYF